jgi:HEAT repeat protein
MNMSNPSPAAKGKETYERLSPANPALDDTPAIGITPPQILAQQAAAGRRGSAWRLLYRVVDNDPHTIVAIASRDDDRLGWNLLECIALSTWAGKPFVVPTPLRSPAARMRLGTLFMPGTGIDAQRAARILNEAMHDSRPELRATAASLLGIPGHTAAAPALIEALWDPAPMVQRASVRALGYTGSPAAVPALLNLLQHADEHLAGQIFSSLVRLGPVAAPALIENSANNSAWMRWHCIRALGEMHDPRALPVLVRGLSDADHVVAWMSAKGLVPFGRRGVGPVLHLLMSAPVTPWLVETASYVLSHQRNPRVRPYLEPVLEQMHGIEFQVGTMLAAHKALSILIADGLIEEGG